MPAETGFMEADEAERNQEMKYRTSLLAVIGVALGCSYQVSGAADNRFEYHLLATNQVPTMQKKLDESASYGYRIKRVMGGETSFDGEEVVIIMEREYSNVQPGRWEYRLLSTGRVSAMQRELQSAADEGFRYCGQTVFNTTFGGKEAVVILERDREAADSLKWEYLLLETRKTSIIQKELSRAADEGYEVVGMTVSSNTFRGKELVVIMKRNLSAP